MPPHSPSSQSHKLNEIQTDIVRVWYVMAIRQSRSYDQPCAIIHQGIEENVKHKFV